MAKMQIRLNSNFYDKDAVEDALKDFSEVCSGRIVDDKITVELSANDDVDNLEDEFSNYVLGLMKNKGI